MFDMLVIEDTEYAQCGLCLNWCPIAEMCWSNELLDWVCSTVCTLW